MLGYSFGGIAVAAALVTFSTARAGQTDYDLGELIRFSVENGSLQATYVGPADLVSRTNRPLKIRSSTARWSIQSIAQMPDSDTQMADRPAVRLSYEDGCSAERDGHVRASVYMDGERFAVDAATRQAGRQFSVKYREYPRYRTAQLEVLIQQVAQWEEPVISLDGEGLQDMDDQHGAEVQQYLMPILKKVTQRNLLGPGPADVYAVFGDIRASDEANAKLRSLLGRLDSPDPEHRKRASADLQRHGTAMVVAALRVDRSMLSPEQEARVDAFLNANRRPSILPINPARPPVQFLTDCLEHEDSAVRSAAKSALEKRLGRPIRFEPRADFDNRLAEVEQLRQEVK